MWDFNQPDECEDYMYRDPVTNLCTFCDYGEYYDFSTDTWRSCGTSWEGFWKYQTSCFSCSDGKILDIETLTWISNWTGKLHIQSSDYEIPSFCRLPTYYVDPLSKSQLELGTLSHPYKTLVPLSAEFLNYYSHTATNVTVYLKSATNVCIQEDQTILMNITSVTFRTYPQNTPRSSLILTISKQKTGLSSRLILVKNLIPNLTNAISKGSLTDYELMLLNGNLMIFKLLRGSLRFFDVDVITDFEHTNDGMFIFPIYLQASQISFGTVFLHNFI